MTNVINIQEYRQHSALMNIRSYLESNLPTRKWGGRSQYWVAIHDEVSAVAITTKFDISSAISLPGDGFGGLLTLFRREDEDQFEIFRAGFRVQGGEVAVKPIRQSDGRLWSAVVDIGDWFAGAARTPAVMHALTDEEIADVEDD